MSKNISKDAKNEEILYWLLYIHGPEKWSLGVLFALSAGAVEYTDCTSAEG